MIKSTIRHVTVKVNLVNNYKNESLAGFGQQGMPPRILQDTPSALASKLDCVRNGQNQFDETVRLDYERKLTRALEQRYCQ